MQQIFIRQPSVTFAIHGVWGPSHVCDGQASVAGGDFCKPPEQANKKEGVLVPASLDKYYNLTAYAIITIDKLGGYEKQTISIHIWQTRGNKRILDRILAHVAWYFHPFHTYEWWWVQSPVDYAATTHGLVSYHCGASYSKRRYPLALYETNHASKDSSGEDTKVIYRNVGFTASSPLVALLDFSHHHAN